MERKYRVNLLKDNNYEVIETTITYGKKISAYDSEPSKVEKNKVFQGTLADCEAYIRLCEGGYM